MVSIVIAYHDEGKQFLLEMIDNLESTIDIDDYEIIVIDDYSKEPVKIEGVHMIRHLKNFGIGAAFDTGVTAAKGENIFLTACDVRFTANNWASKMVQEIESRPTSLICTAVVSLQLEYPEITFDVAKKFARVDSHKGASIKFFIGDDTAPHHIIEASWMPRAFLPLLPPGFVMPTEPYKVPCILGAFYGVSKSWYKYIDGFAGHKFWGTLEPLISIKSYLFGGDCVVAPGIEIGHYFKDPKSTTHGNVEKYGAYKAHNRILTASMLFPEDMRDALIDWIRGTKYFDEGMALIDKDEIEQKRSEYASKTVYPIEEFIKDFNMIFYEQSKII